MKRYMAFLVVLVILTTIVTAIGISPPRLVLDDIPKGYVVEKSVTLSGIKPGSKVTISFEGEGFEWIQSKRGKEFVVQNDKDVELPFIISIPQKAPNGEYEVFSQIIASAQKKSTEPNSATISSGVVATIKFTVSGKEIKNYRIANVQIPNLETGSPLFVVMSIDNQGNVLAKPEKIEVAIKDKAKKEVVSDSTKSITSVEPYTVARSAAVFNLNLEPGFYFGDVQIHKEERVEEIKDIPFDVFERGTLQAEGELIKLEIQENVEKIAKIDAFFVNKGNIDLHSTLKAEVYKKNTLIDVFESDPEYVQKAKQKKITHYYTVPGTGEYTVKAHVSYLGKTTATKKATFRTSESSLETQHYVLISLFAAICIIVSIILMRRKKK